TSCQLVFLYSLLTKKIKNNPSVIADILLPNKKMKIASIDIGAGTSDLVINEYVTNLDGSNISLKPTPSMQMPSHKPIINSNILFTR
ncbi:MAG TPA: virulence factor SrfB, partial [Bacteroidales bacterium]|nr:virulence factor SrfB [Bacteroidales bacterium]